MCYLPQNIHLLRNQLYPVEAYQAQPDEYNIWNAMLPAVEKIPETQPLSAEEVFLLASNIVAASTDKPILIADEPASHLSPELALQMLQLLQQQAAQGKCVLIASRNPQLMAYANRVIDLNQFKI